MASITQLKQYVEDLKEQEWHMFHRMFSFNESRGFMYFPQEFVDSAYNILKEPGENVEQTIARIRSQTVIRTFNQYTGDQVLINTLRARKPGISSQDKEKLKKEVYETLEKTRGCDFCNPHTRTPSDLEVRIESSKCITAANLCGYDAANALLIFKEHNFLNYGEEEISQALDVARTWFREKNKKNANLIYPFIGWNCMKRAGASQDHGHMQLLLTSGKAYQEMEKLRIASEAYQAKFGRNYLREFSLIHRNLGLGFKYRCAEIIAPLVPKKDNDTYIIGENLSDLKEPITKVLKGFNDSGIFAFNGGIYLPPMNRTEGWSDMHQHIARIIDRGNPLRNGTDMAVMELLGTPVVGTDPFKTADLLKGFFDAREIEGRNINLAFNHINL
jgi:hypothetical protein